MASDSMSARPDDHGGLNPRRRARLPRHGIDGGGDRASLPEGAESRRKRHREAGHEDGEGTDPAALRAGGGACRRLREGEAGKAHDCHCRSDQ